MVDVPINFVGNDRGASRIADQLDRKIGGISVGSVAKLGLAVGVVGVAFGALSSVVGETLGRLDSVGKSADRLGVSTNFVQQLGFAAEQTGTSFSDVERAILRSTAALDDASLKPNSPAAQALERLGLNIEDIINLNPEEQFYTLADAIGGVENPTLKSALAQDIYGRSGSNLIPLFNQQREGLERLGAQFVATGGQVEESAIRQAEATNDSLNEMSKTLDAVRTEIVIAILPAIQTGLRLFQEYIVPVFEHVIIPVIEHFGESIDRQAQTVELFVVTARGALIEVAQFIVGWAGEIVDTFIGWGEGIIEVYNNTVAKLPGFSKIDLGDFRANTDEAFGRITATLTQWEIDHELAMASASLNTASASESVILDLGHMGTGATNAGNAVAAGMSHAASATAGAASSIQASAASAVAAFNRMVAAQAQLRGAQMAFARGDIEGTRQQAPSLQSQLPHTVTGGVPPSGGGDTSTVTQPRPVGNTEGTVTGTVVTDRQENDILDTNQEEVTIRRGGQEVRVVVELDGAVFDQAVTKATTYSFLNGDSDFSE